MPIAYGGDNITFADGSRVTSAYTGFKNRIINGGMVFDQRNSGASVTINSDQYTLDRWKAFQSATGKYSVQQNAGSVTPPAGFKNYLGVTSLSSYSVSSGDYFLINQPIEGFNVADLDFGNANAKTVAISFWVRSSLTGTFGAALLNANFNRTYPFTYTISSANTWEYKTVTFAGDTSGTWETGNGNGMQLRFVLGCGSGRLSSNINQWVAGGFDGPTGATSVVGTNGATWYVTGVQLEVGSSASTFDYRPYGTELALCQRYYERWSNTDQNMVGYAYAAGVLNTYNQFLVEKRATPSLLRYGTYTAYVNSGGNTMTYATYNGSTKSANIAWTATTGITAGQAFGWSSGNNPQIAFDAEL